MGNITQYASLETRSFTDEPFNAVDALVLASLAYEKMPATVQTLDDATARYGTLTARMRSWLSGPRSAGTEQPPQPAPPRHRTRGLPFRAPFSDVTLGDVAEELDPKDFDVATGHTGLADPKLTQHLYEAVARSPRFAPIRLDGYADRFSRERQMQFAAVTMLLPDGTLAVVFRGTDDTFVGWKEDFNMAFQYPVPAQHAAAEYVNGVARLWRGPLVLLGHSKGGNLAVYAALNAPEKVAERITKVYSLDGPGFPSSVVNSPAYAAMMDRIEKIVPDSSIVGMIFETPEPCRVVRSDQQGPMQHLAFSWQVNGDDFDYLPEVAHSSQLFNQSLNSWLESMSTEQRERTVDALFSILHASNTDSISGLMNAGLKAVPNMIGTFVGLSDEDRRHLLEAVNLFVSASLARRR
ncbi:DUF2974 domain-containing protein [Bifidobacterium scardovii]|uniref:DUF2974 domain-containing protein n=2 Tax=Bifidobacterium scardovii TaxID=158787 RepID=UPI000666879B